jgi:inosine/xanthosine triphosphate pyrophosphatase family protein
MAELSLEVKNSVSHRGEAARKVPSVLARLGL